MKPSTDYYNKLRVWIVLLFTAMIIMHLVSCQPYPAQSKVVKQDTNRYNPKTGR